MEKVTLKQLLEVNDLTNKVICFPTDTVYGVGCLYNDQVSLNKIYEMKKRDLVKKIPVLINDLNTLKSLCITKARDEQFFKLWPGALTLILRTKNNDTLGFRMPNSSIAIKIIERFGPIQATSVNLSGEKEIDNYLDIETMFSDYIDYLVIDKVTFSNISSTVVDLTNDDIKVLRSGEIKIN